MAFSSLSGCGGQNNAPANGTIATNTTQNSNGQPETATEKTPSPFPPLVSTVAQADLKTMDGSTFKIADKKGKVLLINMWATWCGPCLAEMPAFVRMQDTYGQRGFEILGLDADDESENMMDDINKVVKEKGINYPIVFSDSKTQAALLNISNFDGIPQSFLVDGDGNLRAVFKGSNKETVVKIEQMVADLVGAAHADATRQLDQRSAELMKAAAGPLAGMPGMPKF